MDESQAIININGVELPIDFLDADTLEKFTFANDKMLDALNEPDLYKGKSQPEQMRTQCEITEQFFDDMFGEGTASRVFEGKHSHLGAHVEAFRKIIDAAQEAPGRINRVMGLTDDGNGNAVPISRAQRRLEKYGHTGNYRDRAVKAAPADTAASEEGMSDEMEEALAKEGITKEQFEQAMAILREADGQ